MADGYQELTVESLGTTDGISNLCRMINELYNNMGGDGVNVRIFNGYGSPENVVPAGIGSLYLRKDGTTDTTLYRKESGTEGAGWVAVANFSVPVSIANGGTGETTAQAAIDALTGAADADAGQVYTSDGTNGAWATAQRSYQMFTATGTWVAPAGVGIVYVTGVGGGGGGGGGVGAEWQAGGGGAGAYALRQPIQVTPGSTYNVTVGAGGNGAAFNAAGSNGTDSVFAGDVRTLTLDHGDGAASAVNGGAGGGAVTQAVDEPTAGTGATAHVRGILETVAVVGSSGNARAGSNAGAGGSTHWGAGGAGSVGIGAGTDAVDGTGAGGGGASQASNLGHTGGDGGNGFIYLEW